MKKLVTVTVGIPAYNEEANILSLLSSLLSQARSGWELDQIIVFSDGSTDRTVQRVNLIKSAKIRLIKSVRRVGQAAGQNTLLKSAKSDILLLLNADIKLGSSDFITNLLKPFSENKETGLVSAKVEALPARSFLGRTLAWSHSLKNAIYQQSPDSIYLAHGRARAFARAYYSGLHFPALIAEDAYSYLACLKSGFRFFFQPQSVVYFRVPETLSDHLLQSQRFFRGRTELRQWFDPAVLAEASRLDQAVVLKIWVIRALSSPLYAVSYLMVLLSSYLTRNLNINQTGAVWAPSHSSKKL